MKKRDSSLVLSRGAVAAAVVAALLAMNVAAAATNSNRPTLEIFSKDIVDSIKETGAVAGAMEQSLQGVFVRLDRQEQLYRAAQCESGTADAGCDQLRAQLGKTYLEMLDAMEAKLPDMERSIAVTHSALGKRIREQFGKNMTAARLQDLVKDAPIIGKEKSGAGRALSKRVSAYFDLVRTGAPNAVPSVAAELYLDAHEVTELLGLIREEIGRSRMMVEIGQAWGVVSPEMQNTVRGVKSILFGEESPAGSVTDQIASPLGDAHFRSPLELR